MTEDRFWDLVGQHVVVGPSFEVDVARLRAALEALPAGEIASFDEILARLLRRSHTWELRGAAHVIKGADADEGFERFCAWLVAQGKAVFEKALEEPDSLVEYSAGDMECLDMLVVAYDTYHAITGQHVSTLVYDRYFLGKEWDLEDAAEMKRRYPRLHARYAPTDR